MTKNKWINDPYSNKARDNKLVARSFFKLEEIDKKFELFTKETKRILDIWCAPWSRLQYCNQKVIDLWVQNPIIIWFDLKKVTLNLSNVYSYEMDITNREWVSEKLENRKIEQLDLIVSDMAPDTIGMKDIDALRSVALIEKTLWIYDKFLIPWWKFAIKVFMWPWFEELVKDLRGIYWNAAIQVFKPKSCRKSSKETYIVKKK